MRGAHAFWVSLMFAASGCSLITVQQDPFPALEIRADRGAPPPSRVVLTASSISIADKVQFATGSATILDASFGLLDEVAKVFKDNPQIQIVQIEGHTDSTGSAGFNRTLSQHRAESVRKYLIAKGVEGTRLTAKGFGPDKPLDDAKNDAAYEKNRRVEFNVTKQGPKKTVVQDE